MKRVEAKGVYSIIEEMMERAGMTDDYLRQRVCYLWAEVVGQSINRYTSRRFVEGDRLHVFITSASLKNELLYLRPSLVRRLNEAVGQEIIKDVIIH